MAAPAQINTLRAADFPNGLTSKGDADKLFQILNPFLQQTGAITTKGTSLGQNVDGFFATVQVTTPSDDWADLTLQAGWTAFNAVERPQYRIDAAGTVWVKGLVTSTGIPSIPSNIVAIPANAQPSLGQAVNWLWSAPAVTSGEGTARLEANAFIQLRGQTAPSAAFALLSLDAQWPSRAGAAGQVPGFPVLVRLPDGKRPVYVVAWALNQKTQKVDSVFQPGWTALGQTPTGNFLRLDNIAGLAMATTYQISVFVFF